MTVECDTALTCFDPDVQNPFDIRYVPCPTAPPVEWVGLQNDIALAAADPYYFLKNSTIPDLPAYDAATHALPAGFLPTPEEDVSGEEVHVARPTPQRRSRAIASQQSRVNDGTAYGELLRDRPPPNVRPPLNVDISMAEICTFFPSWLQIPRVILRAVRNGLSREQLAELQLNAVNRLNDGDLRNAVDRIQKQLSVGGKMETDSAGRWNTAQYVAETGLQHDLTANAWKLRGEYESTTVKVNWVDVKLVDIAKSVPRANWPTGDDRSILTACLEVAVANPELDLDTSHWGRIVQDHLPNFTLPAAPNRRAGNRDTLAQTSLFS